MSSEENGSDPRGRPSLRQETWETLVDAVIAQECTPFLGAGVAVPYLPTGTDLSRILAERYSYPLEDVTNLARVSQYVASEFQASFVKRRISEQMRNAQKEADAILSGNLPDNYVRLAKLNLPIYVTTNYDDYLERAIAAQPARSPRREICRWNDRLVADLPSYGKAKPTAGEPLIFHLHGHVETQNSLLVTEDDYIDFTVSLAQRTDAKDQVVPHYVRRALGSTNLLFVGYSLEDWNFRVMMRHLMRQQHVQSHDRYSSISIQLASDSVPPEKQDRAEKFLEKYLADSSAIEVYWGDASDFLTQLSERVELATNPARAS